MNNTIFVPMTSKQRKELIKAQQGELDAVLMYNALAEKAKLQKDKNAFRQLALEEGRHASVFHAYTNQSLKASKTKAILLPVLYALVGRKILYPVIAKFEYDAARNYEHLIPEFPDVASVRDDESRHGDILTSLLKD